MRAIAYQRSELARFCIAGPRELSMKISGFDCVLTEKKKSGPCPSHAVPSSSRLASKVDTTASCSFGLPDRASSISSATLDCSAPRKGVHEKSAIVMASSNWIADRERKNSSRAVFRSQHINRIELHSPIHYYGKPHGNREVVGDHWSTVDGDRGTQSASYLVCSLSPVGRLSRAGCAGEAPCVSQLGVLG